MKSRYAIAILFLAPLTVSAQTAYESATRGATCTQNGQGDRSCKYAIGADFKISITAVGSFDAGVSFLHSDSEGDFFARTSLQHKCVIVAAGKKAPKAALTATGQYAFISPRTGLVYQTWQQCDAAKQ